MKGVKKRCTLKASSENLLWAAGVQRRLWHLSVPARLNTDINTSWTIIRQCEHMNRGAATRHLWCVLFFFAHRFPTGSWTVFPGRLTKGKFSNQTHKDRQSSETTSCDVTCQPICGIHPSFRCNNWMSCSYICVQQLPRHFSVFHLTSVHISR